MLENNDKRQEQNEMIPFFSIASRDFDKDLAILKKYYVSLSKGPTQKMHTNSVK
jgi:hypothetical protein